MNTKITHREEIEQSTARSTFNPSRNMFSGSTTPKTGRICELLLDFKDIHDKFNEDPALANEPKDAPSSVGESFIRDLEEAIDPPIPVPVNNTRYT